MKLTVWLLSGVLAWASVSDMVRLKSRTQAAINGFQFVDAAISPDVMQSWDFEQLCRDIQARRLLNARFGLTTDLNAIRQEADLQNALRMQHIRGAESYIVGDDGGRASFPAAPRPGGLKNAAAKANQLFHGAETLRQWLGDGGAPVDGARANSRAAGCAACPQNHPGDLTSWFTVPVAAKIQEQIERRNGMKLATPDDAKLGVCAACACPLKLKVHVPLPHIAAHLTGAVKLALDANCWILKETQSTT